MHKPTAVVKVRTGEGQALHEFLKSREKFIIFWDSLYPRRSCRMMLEYDY